MDRANIKIGWLDESQLRMEIVFTVQDDGDVFLHKQAFFPDGLVYLEGFKFRNIEGGQIPKLETKRRKYTSEFPRDYERIPKGSKRSVQLELLRSYSIATGRYVVQLQCLGYFRDRETPIFMKSNELIMDVRN